MHLKYFRQFILNNNAVYNLQILNWRCDKVNETKNIFLRGFNDDSSFINTCHYLKQPLLWNGVSAGWMSITVA